MINGYQAINQIVKAHSKWTTLKVNSVIPTTIKKTVPNIPKNVVTAKLGHLYNNEVQQNQKAQKSVLVAEALIKIKIN